MFFLLQLLFALSVAGSIEAQQRPSAIPLAHSFYFLSDEEKWFLANERKSVAQIAFMASDEKGLRKLFHTINKLSHKMEVLSFPSKQEEKLAKNQNHIALDLQDVDSNKNDLSMYRGVNVVTSDSLIFIIGPAPLTETVTDFWKLILEKKIPLIVTLVMPDEGAGESCYPYWTEASFSMFPEGWKIEKQREEVITQQKEQKIVSRTFCATCPKSGQSHTFCQLHFERWPDNKAPNVRLFCRFLDVVASLHLRPEDPIFVHCRAGMGRSGTFALSYILKMRALQEQEKTGIVDFCELNIPEELLWLRLQRKGIIGTLTQFQCVYQTVGSFMMSETANSSIPLAN